MTTRIAKISFWSSLLKSPINLRVPRIGSFATMFLALFLLSSANLFAELQGVVLVGQKKVLLSSKELRNIYGVHVYEVDLPGSLPELQSALNPVYLHKRWTPETVSEIKQAVYRYYQKKQRPFIVISVPRQDKESYVLQLLIEESKLGIVEVVGNRWTSSKRIKQYFTTKPGEPISLRRLSRDVNFMNRDPFRFVNAIYSPGAKENTTDITLDVHDRKPYRFYAGFDNTGVLATGRQRVFAGFSWDQVFGLDHVFFYQYTTNYNAQRFHANTFQYMALLPCQNVLNLYGGFSVVHANIPSPNRNNKGTNIQASLRYQIPLYPYRFFSHEIVAGVDVKNTNNTMEFVDFSPTFGQTVNLTQLVLGYQAKWGNKRNVLEGGIEVLCSPVAWLPNQTNADFGSLRPSAKHEWTYATAFVKFQQPLPRDFSYEVFIRGQMSSQVLLPSEQLPLGGYGSIRGYDVRQFNADAGFFANIEFHSPGFSVIRRKQPHKDNLYFLVFLDGGYGIDKVPVPEIKPHEYLIGIGPGVRYSLDSYLTARCDWGIKLHHQDGFTGGGSMVYFSVIGSF